MFIIFSGSMTMANLYASNRWREDNVLKVSQFSQRLINYSSLFQAIDFILILTFSSKEEEKLLVLVATKI